MEKLNVNMKTQEEAVLSNLLLTSYGQDQEKMNKYYRTWSHQWGLISLKNNGNATWQGPDYSTTEFVQSYCKSWSPPVFNTRLSRETSDRHGRRTLDPSKTFRARLVYVATANAGAKHGTGSMARTYSPKAAGDYEFFKATVRGALSAGLVQMAMQGISVAVVSRIGTGVYAPRKWKSRIIAEFDDILQGVLDSILDGEKTIGDHFESVVVAKV